jgi:phosphate transport system permease protein
VPDAHREAAIALGAQPWDVVRVAVLPSARRGIAGAVVLGFGRAIGETMAVALVIGARPGASASLVARGYSIASVIANEFAGASATGQRAALSAVALLLLAAALAVSLVGRRLMQSPDAKRTARAG